MTAFASQSDVEARLQRVLSTAEAGFVSTLLDLASIVIAEGADKQVSYWDQSVAEPVAIPGFLRVLCTELVSRVFANPRGVEQYSQTLGKYSVSERYAVGNLATPLGIQLTEQEMLAVRRAVFGTNTGSVDLDSLVDKLQTDLVGLGLPWLLNGPLIWIDGDEPIDPVESWISSQ